MARRIMVLAAAAVVVCGYFIFMRDRDDFIYFFSISLVVLVLAYIFQHQIRELEMRGVPQALDDEMRQMLIQTTPQFAGLPASQRQMIEDRMKRWVVRKDFINMNEQDAPEDVKYILAWYAILLSLHQKSFLYKELDRIAFYHHPFLSPRHPDDAHIAEIEPEDGTIIISVPHLIRGHMEKGLYNLALHTQAAAYASCYLHTPIEWPDDIWDQLEAISSISREKIEAYIGLPVQDPWPVAVHHQVTYKGVSIPEVQTHLPQFLSIVNGHA